MKGITSVLLSLTVIILSSILTFCEKNEEKAPSLPPESSMIMDFSDFSNQQKSTQVVMQNWGYAALNVAFWNLMATVTSAVPVAAFSESFNHTATFLGDKTWEWTYSINHGGVTYVSRMEGEIVSDSVDWRMYISMEGSEGSEFLWFNGRSASDRSGGWWILNENPQNPNALLKIDWENYGDSQGKLRYTYVKSNQADYGNYIEFIHQSIENIPFDSFYTISNKSENKDLLIEWNNETKEGRVKKYGEDSWNCWNSQLVDVACE